MFVNERFSDLFFQSEDESQHFRIAEEDHTYSFTMSGLLSIERNCQSDKEKSNEYLAHDIEAGHVFIQEEDVQSNHAVDGSTNTQIQELQNKINSPIASSSLHLLKKNGQKQINPSPSKNFLLYAWKKVLKCLKLSNNPKLQQYWRTMKNQKGSLKTFDHLFRSLKGEEDFTEIFESKILLHWLMLSPVDSFLKKAYLSYFRRLEHSHKKGYLHHLK